MWLPRTEVPLVAHPAGLKSAIIEELAMPRGVSPYESTAVMSAPFPT
jgi:hypothetical protein